MQRSQLISSLCAVVLLIASLSFLVVHTAQSPERVFNDMLRNNLSTNGVTLVMRQSVQAAQIAQYSQLSFGVRPQVHALTVVEQNGRKLATEEISTVNSDLVRYQNVQLPDAAAAKYKPVVGKWAKLQANGVAQTGLTSGLFKQALLGTLPIANLQPAARDKLLATIEHNKVFSYNAKTTHKVTINGRSTYQYAVSVNSQSYIVMMQQFEKLIGQTSFENINPASYAHASPIMLQINIDTISHQLARINQLGNGRTEDYRAFGITDTTSLPKATISATQLTKLLSGA